MDAQTFTRSIRQNALLIALWGATVALAAMGFSLAATPLYQSSARVYVAISGEQTPPEALQAYLFLERRMRSYATLASSRALLDRVVTANDLPLTAAELAEAITVSSPDETVLLSVTVTYPDPGLAQRAANAVANEFAVAVREFEAAATTPVVNAVVVDSALLPTVPISPFTLRNVALGAVLGLNIGAIATVNRARGSRILQETSELEAALAAPVTGSIPFTKHRLRRRSPLHPLTNTGSYLKAAEAFAEVGASIRFPAGAVAPTVLAVTTPTDPDLAVFTAAATAESLAQAGCSVLLVDADPALRITADDFHPARPPAQPGSVRVAAAPGEPEHLAELLAAGAHDYDYVIVAAPPLLTDAGSGAVCAACDGCLLAVQHGPRMGRQLLTAKVHLDQSGGVLHSIVTARGAGAYKKAHAALSASPRARLRRLG